MRADGRTGSRIAIFGEAIWYNLPKTADLTKLDDRWRTAIWLGKSEGSDELITRLENGAVLAAGMKER